MSAKKAAWTAEAPPPPYSVALTPVRVAMPDPRPAVQQQAISDRPKKRFPRRRIIATSLLINLGVEVVLRLRPHPVVDRHSGGQPPPLPRALHSL